MKKIAKKTLAAFFLLALFLGALPLPAQDSPLWLRYPAISPDGGTILFCYQGDIYKVPASGGQAMPLTIGEAYDFAPVWSHNGRSIAFASDRHGNFDVFVIPASGGEARRLTYHSAGDIPSSFSADDQHVLFTAGRHSLATNAKFPTPALPELYSVSVSGGEAALVLPQPAMAATVSPDGDKIIYHDQKGYESDWRKHHTSAVTRDIWVYDRKAKKNTRLTTFKGEDRNPVFAGEGDDFYYLSEQSGSFNVYKSSLSRPATAVALTSFSKNPVRFLSRSATGVLCFGYDGGIYTQAGSAAARRVDVRIAQDGRLALAKALPVGGGITQMRLSPNGKEIAYVFRGEVFVGSVEGGVGKRITDTPWQERSVSFSPDGRTLVYAAERDNNWNLYTTTIARKEEPYFYAATVLREEPLLATAAEEFQPEFSPDGKEVAYLEDRVVLKVINLASRQVRTILPAEHNYSYADGDQDFCWSPDGKWFLVQFGYVRLFTGQVGLVASDGRGKVINLTKSGFDSFGARWGMDGAMMVYGGTRDGAANVSGQSVTSDIYGMFFTRDAFDRFRLSKPDFALLKELEDKAKENKDKGNKEKTKDGKDAATKKTEPRKDVVIELEGLDQRKVRFTISSADIAGAALSKSGDKLFYLARFEKGYDLWQTELRTKETKLFTKLGAERAGLELAVDGKALFVLADGKISKIDPENGKAEPVAVSSEMILDPSAEKGYMFDHMWRQIKQKFLVADLYGADWDLYYATYRKFLPHIANNYDYAEMVSEMLGELNASHTGCYYAAPRLPEADATASLGFYRDFGHAGPGLKVAAILSGGPLDKAALKVRAGHIVEKIDGQVLDGTFDHARLLNRKADQLILLSLLDPATKRRWEEAVKPMPMGGEGALLYPRWVKARRAEVDRLSNGRIGYVHVRGMNDASFRTVIEEVLGLSIDKEALIVDTRFNGGGNLHDQLADFLDGKKVFDILPRGQLVGHEPYGKWIKPSIVVMGEGNYSDAHLFPVEYKIRGIGKTLGMPVPGTGTFVWWERQIDPSLRFGIPQGGWRTPEGILCENNQLEPDILVRNDPDVLSLGRDQQLEEAVKELLTK
jgi:Tol biopolymer transport system component/C-terminal processing protease CtpA/Prc